MAKEILRFAQDDNVSSQANLELLTLQLDTWNRSRFGEVAVASNDNPNPDFDEFLLPTEQFEAGPVDGMPDPTAQPDEPLSEEELLEQPTEEEEGEGDAEAASPQRLGWFAEMTQASPFTVLLAISLAAILVAIFCMIMQLATYGFDYKAKSATRQAASAEVRFIEPAEAELV